LLDLLGFDFYQHLQALEKCIQQIVPENNTMRQLLARCTDRYPGNWLGLYLRLMREEAKTPASEEIMDQYSYSPQTFLKAMNTLYDCCSKTVRAASPPLQGCESPTEARLKQQAFATNYRNALLHLQRLNHLNGLFEKILKSPYSKDLLTSSYINCFEGSEQLDRVQEIQPSQKLAEIPAVNHLADFLTFIDASFKSGNQHGIAACTIDYFALQRDLLQANKDKTASTPLIERWNLLFHSLILMVEEPLGEMLYDLSEAEQGRLTHKQWLEKNKLQVARTKTKAEFCESLRVSTALFRLAELWEEDINQMIELHLFCPLFPKDYWRKEKIMNYFVLALFNLISTAMQEQKPPPENTLPFLGDWKRQAHESCKPLYAFLGPSILEKLENLVGNVVPYGNFIQFMRTLGYGSILTQKLCSQLPKLQARFEDNLKTFLKQASLEDLRAHKKEWISQIKKEYSQQIGEIYLFIIYFRDLESLFNRLTFLKDWDYMVPAELKSLFSVLEQIPRMFDKAESEKMRALPPAPVETAPRTAEAVPAPAAAIASPLPPKGASPSPPREKSREELLLEELKQATKRREFQRILTELGFNFERHGRHEIWANEEGHTIPLPFHNGGDTIKRGTLQGMIKQLRAALNLI
jgi:predicted RNA binding protein YcfA (HicA-like mRNA interferase family)